MRSRSSDGTSRPVRRVARDADRQKAMLALVLMDHYLRQRARNGDVIPLTQPFRLAPTSELAGRAIVDRVFRLLQRHRHLPPFWSPYLALRGFGAFEIGLLLAIAAGVRRRTACVWLACRYVWTSDGDLAARRALVASQFCGAAAAVHRRIHRAHGVLLLRLEFHRAFARCAHATGLGSTSALHGRIRLWGSLGFITLAWLGGVIFQRVGYELVPTLMLVFITATLLATMSIASTPPSGHAPPTVSFRAAVRSRPGVGSVARRRACRVELQSLLRSFRWPSSSSATAAASSDFCGRLV